MTKSNLASQIMHEFLPINLHRRWLSQTLLVKSCVMSVRQWPAQLEASIKVLGCYTTFEKMLYWDIYSSYWFTWLSCLLCSILYQENCMMVRVVARILEDARSSHENSLSTYMQVDKVAYIMTLPKPCVSRSLVALGRPFLSLYHNCSIWTPIAII